MYATLRQNFYWHNMANEVFETIRNCNSCERVRVILIKAQKEMQIISSHGPLDFIAMDLLGLFLKSKKDNMSVLVKSD